MAMASALAAWPAVANGAACGEPVALQTHARTTTRYALAVPPPDVPQEPRVALVLLVGGNGRLDLDDMGCPHALLGNWLVRAVPHFLAAGFVAALVDAPSDQQGEDGLGGFRIAEAHAQDIGLVVADVRSRTKAGSVWLVGTSRGTISAANAASRLAGPQAPDGVVLTSALMSGTAGGRKTWTAHTVFDLPLESIRMPLLVVGHAQDKCLRSPAGQMGKVAERTQAARGQVVTVTGGAGHAGPVDLAACEGRSPHGFLGQEAEVAAGIARFVRGGRY